MEVNEVRGAKDEDFQILTDYLSGNEGWNKEYEKKAMSVFTRSDSADSDFKMLRVKTEFSDVSPSTLFDVIQDPIFRKKWDVHMLEYKNIGYLSPTDDIGYYSISCPPPIKNRDFVIQSSWRIRPDEYMIINHSVAHKDCPHKPGFVRGISYLTGFLIRASGDGGCSVGYVTHCNPKGRFPKWISNKLSTTLAPKLVKRIRKACLKYDKWKKSNNPEYKPWLNSEQIEGKKIDLKDCVLDEPDNLEAELEENLQDLELYASDSDSS